MKKILIATLTLLSLPACDLLTEPGPDRSGRVSFSIPGPDGQTAGTFNANGTISRDSLDIFTLGNWAFAELLPYRSPQIAVFASAPAGNGRFHHFWMDLPGNVAVGTVLEAQINCMHTDSGCARIRLITNMVDTYFLNGDGPKVSCGAEQGTVNITARGAGRIKGTFAVTKLCYVHPANARFEYSVSDGSFDLPLIERSLPSPAT